MAVCSCLCKNFICALVAESFSYWVILYFSILLNCIVQWVLQVVLPSACSSIVDVSTTRKGKQTSKQTHMQETENKEDNRIEKHK
jgi:hypothetical protein